MTATYKTGQITLANGSAVVTGVGTAWATMLIAGGIIFPVAGGNPLAIQDVVSNTSITAEQPWAGVSGTYDYVLVRWSADEEQNSVNSTILATIYAELQAGSLWKYDVAGSSADRLTYDERPKGFSYLVVDVNPAQLYIKASATSADWAGPFTYATGPAGPEGPAGYVNLRGTYSAATAYAKNDGVLYNGSSFVALKATTGNAPPTLPTTSDANWQILAIKGTDGTGTGDVVGPGGATDDVPAFFDGTTGKLLKGKSKTAFKTWLAASAAEVSFSNTTAALPGSPATVQAAIDALASNSGGKQDAIFALEIADLKGVRMGMNGGIADSFDDTTGIDAATSSNYTYDATNDYFYPTPSSVIGIDTNAISVLHFDGTNNSTTITDSALTPKTWTASGDAKISTAQSVFGGASLFVDGSGDYVTSAVNAAFALGTADFTIEGRFRPSASPSTGNLIEFRSSSQATNPVLYINSSGVATYYAQSANRIIGTTVFAANTWYHIALVRSSGVTRLYVNGIQEGSNFSDTGNYPSPAAGVRIGASSAPGDYFTGYIDEVRISNVARWTAAFTPPPAQYDTTVTYGNMTLTSVTYTATATPGTARIALQLADSVALTPNTDFIMEVSRNGGVNWTTAILALTVNYGGIKMYEATVSLSAQPSGSNMVWRMKSLTNKNVIASGVVLQQS